MLNPRHKRCKPAFSDSVTNFSNVLKEADTQLNGLDVTSEGAADQMLEILDNLDNEFGVGKRKLLYSISSGKILSKISLSFDSSCTVT